MPNINVMKTIENTDVNENYCLRSTDMQTIFKNSNDAFYMISNAFIYGYARGQRAERAKRKKSIKQQTHQDARRV